ncbi:hypothetical protein L1887_44907 [Cichorium endivia]|nr:hypothetical protein L1887_44907 [Cichorium endivia]
MTRRPEKEPMLKGGNDGFYFYSDALPFPGFRHPDAADLPGSSGEALQAALVPGNLELVKPNQKELSALVNRELTQPDDVRTAAQELVRSGKARRVVVSLGPQGALAVDESSSVQVVPPPMKSQSTVGAGDSMVGAMTLKLAQGASLLEMTRYGVAAGSAATINQGTRLCTLAFGLIGALSQEEVHALAASLVESVTDKPAEIDVDTWESWRKKEQ